LTGLANENAVAAVVPPWIAWTTMIPSLSVSAPAPPAFVKPIAVSPVAAPCEITSFPLAEPSAPSTLCISNLPPWPA
jgi:hypothetical protein